MASSLYSASLPLPALNSVSELRSFGRESEDKDEAKQSPVLQVVDLYRFIPETRFAALCGLEPNELLPYSAYDVVLSDGKQKVCACYLLFSFVILIR